jgi:hypothetical protein
MFENLSGRECQKEAARALAVWKPGNNELRMIADGVHQDSQAFYRKVIQKYVDEHGDLPSKVGPGKEIKLLYD